MCENTFDWFDRFYVGDRVRVVLKRRDFEPGPHLYSPPGTIHSSIDEEYRFDDKVIPYKVHFVRFDDGQVGWFHDWELVRG